ncbi:AbrB/MazE/SpoVT family DNA-binding domain-containing protein [bacterium AH-315-C08]|nr:AbrB/MazE/SpoVT family DNA-binding domain-containing protein [bacterium AH-315-C08]
MSTIVTNWGNSLGIRIPKNLANDLGIFDGSEVDLNLRNNSIVIKVRTKNRKKIQLENLTKKMSTSKVHHEIDWGKPVGDEVW